MRSAFLSPKEYRDFSAQCLRWAVRAKREEHKNMMLQMADHWMHTAQKLERADTYRCVPVPLDEWRKGRTEAILRGIRVSVNGGAVAAMATRCGRSCFVVNGANAALKRSASLE